MFAGLPGHAEVVIQVGTAYVDAGAAAADAKDGDLTSKIVVTNTVNANKIGTYTVTYAVTNSLGIAASPIVRTVRVVDTTKPVITLNGSTSVTVKKGTTYTDAGAKATDNYDGDITSKIAATGNVNTSKTGTYFKCYNVKDSSLNAATQVARKVVVSSTGAKSAQAESEDLILTSPLDTSTVNVEADMNEFTMVLTAKAPENSIVAYAVDDVPVGSSTEDPYAVSVEFDMINGAIGPHTIIATAELSAEEVLSAVSTFTVVQGAIDDDTDLNGIVDNPFARLTSNGDMWIGLSKEGVAVTAVRVGKDAAIVPVGTATVVVPKGALREKEAGVVIVQASDALESFAQKGVILSTEGASLVAGGQFVTASVLNSPDDGGTFEALAGDRLADNPVMLRLHGPELAKTKAYVRPVNVDSNETTGVFVVAGEGKWGVAEYMATASTLAVNLTAPSMVAPFLDSGTLPTEAGINWAGVAGSLKSFSQGRGGTACLILLSVTLAVMLYSRTKSRTVTPVNNREFERYNAHFNVTLCVGGPSLEDSTFSSARAHNISHGGLLLETSQKLSPGQTVTVSIPTEMCPAHLALPSMLSGDAEVVRSQGGKVGLRFTDSLRKMPEFAAFLDYIGSTSEPLLA